jgi:hypothetical protein
MEPIKIAVMLTVPEWNVVMNALGGRPYLEVADIINSVKGQADEAVAQMAAATKDDSK